MEKEQACTGLEKSNVPMIADVLHQNILIVWADIFTSNSEFLVNE
jgi:hypothetical protein